MPSGNPTFDSDGSPDWLTGLDEEPAVVAAAALRGAVGDPEPMVRNTRRGRWGGRARRHRASGQQEPPDAPASWRVAG